MNLRDVLNEMPNTDAKRVFAKTCGTTLAYLHKLSGGHCLPSVELLSKMIERDSRLTLEDFVAQRQKRLADHKRKRRNAFRSMRA